MILAIEDPLSEAVARRSRRKDIRADLVPETGSTSAVGPVYNPRLALFVEATWDPVAASVASPSLAKAVARLRSAFGGAA